ncbi:hypothetical protein, partial [Paenibacillus sp.]|uniref:hypothetical protein n=1 Tax=Paenibacillus sp. TaxID=58172 RepID=UPI0034643989
HIHLSLFNTIEKFNKGVKYLSKLKKSIPYHRAGKRLFLSSTVIGDKPTGYKGESSEKISADSTCSTIHVLLA